jgi:hypothetical protein
MSLISWFEWVQEFPSAVAIRESLYYSYLLAFHAVSMVLFAGFILMMDLRLVGVAFPDTEVSHVQKRLFPWQMFFMVLSAISGAALFYGNPMRYYGKVFFWVKMALMVFAGVNALLFHWTTYRSVAQWDRLQPPSAARLAGVVSIALWAGVIVFGRITAYNWMTYE